MGRMGREGGLLTIEIAEQDRPRRSRAKNLILRFEK